MADDWMRIKQARPDLTDYLIHWTRKVEVAQEAKSAFGVLKNILECGYLIPTFAPRRSVTANRAPRPTIRGTEPVVCFTEQPLSAFMRSCKTLTDRYSPYGIAVRKDRLYEYGGRPVVYGDNNLLNSLPVDHQYLWVNFQPIPQTQFGGFPLDWTHEREWRSKVMEYHVPDRGPYVSEGVPLLLPPDGDKLLLPWILVSTEAESSELRQWMHSLPDCDDSNAMTREYRRQLLHCPILPLELAQEKLSTGNDNWGRFDTLPYWELDPNSAANLEKIGWNYTPST